MQKLLLEKTVAKEPVNPRDKPWCVNLNQWSRYISGGREMLQYIDAAWSDALKWDERVYFKAEVKLAMSSRENTWRYLLREPIGYRNHQSNKKGKLIECEAYFIENQSFINH